MGYPSVFSYPGWTALPAFPHCGDDQDSSVIFAAPLLNFLLYWESQNWTPCYNLTHQCCGERRDHLPSPALHNAIQEMASRLSKKGHIANSCSTQCPPRPPRLFYGAPAGNLSNPWCVLVPGAVLPLVQDLAVPHAELLEILVSSFLQSVQVHLDGLLVHQAYFSVSGHLQTRDFGSAIGCLALMCSALNCCWIMLGTELFIPILIKAESMNLQERKSFFLFSSCIICTIALSCIVSYFLLHYL